MRGQQSICNDLDGTFPMHKRRKLPNYLISALFCFLPCILYPSESHRSVIMVWREREFQKIFSLHEQALSLSPFPFNEDHSVVDIFDPESLWRSEGIMTLFTESSGDTDWNNIYWNKVAVNNEVSLGYSEFHSLKNISERNWFTCPWKH